jgi:hypothetical protein
MEKTLDKIGNMSVELIAMMRIATDHEVGDKTAATRALQLVNQISILYEELPDPEVIHMDHKLHLYTRWIANGPVAQS